MRAEPIKVFWEGGRVRTKGGVVGERKGGRVVSKFVTWSNDRQRSGVSPFDKWHLRRLENYI
jgi:hypothetical protein